MNARTVAITLSGPCRVQLLRTKGWRMPLNTVKVDRTTKWGNPFRIGEAHPDCGHPMRLEDTVELFRKRIGQGPPFDLEAIRAELRGRNLGCWCPPGQACHADILLRIANSR